MIQDENYPYQFDPSICSTCEGNCCIGESGYIWITKQEIQKLADFLDVPIEQLAKEYLFKVGYKYSIKEKLLSPNNYACVFFDLNKKCCSVYEARPVQCRTFPFWEHFKTNIEEVKKECPAIVMP